MENDSILKTSALEFPHEFNPIDDSSVVLETEALEIKAEVASTPAYADPFLAVTGYSQQPDVDGCLFVGSSDPGLYLCHQIYQIDERLYRTRDRVRIFRKGPERYKKNIYDVRKRSQSIDQFINTGDYRCVFLSNDETRNLNTWANVLSDDYLGRTNDWQNSIEFQGSSGIWTAAAYSCTVLIFAYNNENGFGLERASLAHLVGGGVNETDWDNLLQGMDDRERLWVLYAINIARKGSDENQRQSSPDLTDPKHARVMNKLSTIGVLPNQISFYQGLGPGYSKDPDSQRYEGLSIGITSDGNWGQISKEKVQAMINT